MEEFTTVRFDDTGFIYKTNFSGDPERDNFGSTVRKACVIIPDADLAEALAADGFNVKISTPREEGDVPVHYISITANYDSKWPPRIYVVSGNKSPRLLDEDTVGEIDHIRIANVNVICNPYINKRTGRKSLYIKTMYVEQDTESDPYASRYMNNYSDVGF